MFRLLSMVKLVNMFKTDYIIELPFGLFDI